MPECLDDWGFREVIDDAFEDIDLETSGKQVRVTKTPLHPTFI